MREAWIVVMLMAPLALAQAPDLVLVELEVDPFQAIVRPLQGAETTAVHARVSCALARSPAGVPFSYQVASAPPWAIVSISPASDVVTLNDCQGSQGGWVAREAVLTASVTDEAPAFTPQPIEVVLTTQAATDSAQATTNVSADYFSILDVTVPEALLMLPPGGSHEFVVGVKNKGNGATRITFEIAEGTSDGLIVTLPEPFVLESKQAGGTQTARDVNIRVETPPRPGIVNEVGVINVRIRGEYADDAMRKGDESQVSFLVTTRSDVFEKAKVPGFEAGFALIAALMLGAATRRRR